MAELLSLDRGETPGPLGDLKALNASENFRKLKKSRNCFANKIRTLCMEKSIRQFATCPSEREVKDFELLQIGTGSIAFVIVKQNMQHGNIFWNSYIN